MVSWLEPVINIPARKPRVYRDGDKWLCNVNGQAIAVKTWREAIGLAVGTVRGYRGIGVLSDGVWRQDLGSKFSAGE